MEDLLTLSASPSQSAHQTWPTYMYVHVQVTISPFLCCHLDKAFTSYIHPGLVTALHIGFTHDQARLSYRKKNRPSSLANRVVLDQRISTELSAGRLLGAIPSQLLPGIHISPLGQGRNHTNLANGVWSVTFLLLLAPVLTMASQVICVLYTSHIPTPLPVSKRVTLETESGLGTRLLYIMAQSTMRKTRPKTWPWIAASKTAH